MKAWVALAVLPSTCASSPRASWRAAVSIQQGPQSRHPPIARTVRPMSPISMPPARKRGSQMSRTCWTTGSGWFKRRTGSSFAGWSILATRPGRGADFRKSSLDHLESKADLGPVLEGIVDLAGCGHPFEAGSPAVGGVGLEAHDGPDIPDPLRMLGRLILQRHRDVRHRDVLIAGEVDHRPDHAGTEGAHQELGRAETVARPSGRESVVHDQLDSPGAGHHPPPGHLLDLDFHGALLSVLEGGARSGTPTLSPFVDVGLE